MSEKQHDDLTLRADRVVEHAAHGRRLLHRGAGGRAGNCAARGLEQRGLVNAGRGAQDE